MTTLDVRFEGVDEVRARLAEFGGPIAVRMEREALSKVARRVVRLAKRPDYRFEDRSGVLRSTFRARLYRQRAIPALQILIGGPGARQGYIIEYGRRASARASYAAPRPAIRGAVEAAGGGDALAADLAAEIERRLAAFEL